MARRNVPLATAAAASIAALVLLAVHAWLRPLPGLEALERATIDARFRVRLGVAGNRLTEVTHFGFIPQSFERRFEELRSSNNTIAGAASLAAGVLYGLGGQDLRRLGDVRRVFVIGGRRRNACK